MSIVGFSLVPIALVLLAVIFVLMGVKTVPQGYQYTIERFGKYIKTLDPGLHLIIPFIDIVGRKVNMMEQVLDISRQEAITKDNAGVQVDGIVFYQILDAPSASYEVNNLQYAILNLAMTNIRTVMGGMDLDELLSNRDAINAKLLTVINEATSDWGVKVTRVEIKDISPPQDIMHAMHKQMTAEREKRAAILQAEGFREAEIRKAEGERQSMILEAEGRLESAKKDAEARERLAQAEAKATEMVSKAISEGDVNAINYFVAQKYIDAIRDISVAKNSKLIFAPLDSSSIIGAIGGIAELTRDAFARQKEAADQKENK